MVTGCSRGRCLLLTDLSLHRDVARSVVRRDTRRGDRRRWGAVGRVRLTRQRSAAVTTCAIGNVNNHMSTANVKDFHCSIVYSPTN